MPDPRLVRSRWSPGLFWFGLGVVLLWLVFERDWGPGGESIPYLGVLTILVALYPFGRRLADRFRGRDPGHRVPFLPIIGAICAIYYGLPVLLQDRMALNQDLVVPRDAVRAAAIAGLAGVVALLVAYYRLTPTSWFGGPLRFRWDVDRARRLGLGLAIVGLVVTAVPMAHSALAGAGQVHELLQSFLQLGLGVLFVLHLDGRLGVRARLFLFAFGLPFLLFRGIGTGSTANAAYVVLFFCMLTWGCGRRVPIGLLAAAGLLFALLRGSADEFRREVWYSSAGESLSSVDRARLFLDIVGSRVLGDGDADGEGVVDQVAAVMTTRTNQLALLAHVVDSTPRVVPYWQGESYRTLITSFVPRMLWPDKPSKLLGQEFGHRYGILALTDTETSVNVPLLVEFYANFGLLGVVLGMALLGILYRVLDVKLNGPTAGRASIVIAAQVMTRLCNVESDFSLTFGAVLYQVIALYLVFTLLDRGTMKRSRRPRPATSLANPMRTG